MPQREVQLRRGIVREILFHIADHADDLVPGRVRVRRLAELYMLAKRVLIWEILPRECLVDYGNEGRVICVPIREIPAPEQWNAERLMQPRTDRTIRDN